MQYQTKVVDWTNPPRSGEWNDPIAPVCNTEAAAGWTLHSVTPIISGGNFSGSSTRGFVLVFQKARA